MPFLTRRLALGLIAAVRHAGVAPYGMDQVWWDGVLVQADALVGLRDAPEPDDDAVVAAASELRDALRPFV